VQIPGHLDHLFQDVDVTACEVEAIDSESEQLTSSQTSISTEEHNGPVAEMNRLGQASHFGW
jgi:hypothetical protein